jgi:hypothetical protein
VVTRFANVTQISPGVRGISYAPCEVGEEAVGGGWSIAGTQPAGNEYQLEADRPSREEGGTHFPTPAGAEPAPGWVAELLSTATTTEFAFRAYAMCARPQA